MDHECDDDTICNWYSLNDPQMVGNCTGEVKTRDGPILLKLQVCWSRTEYWEEFRILGETCCRADSTERPSTNAGVKNSQKSKIIFLKTKKKERENERSKRRQKINHSRTNKIGEKEVTFNEKYVHHTRKEKGMIGRKHRLNERKKILIEKESAYDKKKKKKKRKSKRSKKEVRKEENRQWKSHKIGVKKKKKKKKKKKIGKYF